jgi:hypothetical protein
MSKAKAKIFGPKQHARHRIGNQLYRIRKIELKLVIV